MSIQPINQYFPGRKFNKYELVKITGYGAIAAGALSVIQASRGRFKSHKKLGVLTIGLSLAHLGIIKYFNRK